MDKSAQEIITINVIQDFKNFNVSKIDGIGLLEVIKLMIYNDVLKDEIEV